VFISAPAAVKRAWSVAAWPLDDHCSAGKSTSRPSSWRLCTSWVTLHLYKSSTLLLGALIYFSSQNGTNLPRHSDLSRPHKWDNTKIRPTRAVLSPGNRAKPCKFRYVKSVRNFMWKLCYRKMTAQCALCVGALKFVGTLWRRPRLLFSKFFKGFNSDRPYECSYKIWSS